jgi:mannosyltransferase OCH1-like enzyme
MNPGFGYTLWTDEMVHSFIAIEFGEAVWKVYDVLVANAYRADLFRYMVIFIRGGWYADVDVQPHTPLDHVNFPKDAQMITARYNTPPYPWMFEANFFGGMPGHPIL